ncbi:transposase [Streptomyces sp. NBC_00963]|uniref:transposase n=1 Tax=unclassified Streptomyces TaxID=2593676 RepID=UPI003863F063
MLPLQEIQTRARHEQGTSEWQEPYAVPAGWEATVCETDQAHDLHHCRYHGMARTHVQHVLTAAGTNTIRLSQCFPPGNAPPPTARTARHAQVVARIRQEALAQRLARTTPGMPSIWTRRRRRRQGARWPASRPALRSSSVHGLTCSEDRLNLL